MEKTLFGFNADWGSVVSSLTIIAGLVFWGISVQQTNAVQDSNISRLQTDVTELNRSIPFIRESLGRIEGVLGTNHADESRRPK